jgi:ABC-3C biological conflict system middle component
MSDTLQPWWVRPREFANLYNPAFTSLVLARAVRNHEDAGGQRGLPLALAFLVLPIVLHARFRDRLPRAADTDMFGWMARHADLRLLLPAHAEAMKAVSQEAMRFGLHHGALALRGPDLCSGPRKFGKTSMPPVVTDEVAACLQKAAFVGRWFAVAAATTTILATLGVRP